MQSASCTRREWLRVFCGAVERASGARPSVSQFPWQHSSGATFPPSSPYPANYGGQAGRILLQNQPRGLKPLAESCCPFGADDVPPLKQDGRSAQLMLY